ncbi:MAG: AAA family ATPase [Candidatus Levybacteria bacterium]|nr:AAA family ATPase [Candidatus Levybacteria bacterium]
MPVDMTPETESGHHPNGEGGAESPLPEIRLTQVVKSASPVVPERILREKTMEEKALLVPYGEYTFLIVRDSGRIALLDANGKNVEEFANLGSTMILDWDSIRTKRVTRITRLTAAGKEEISVHELKDPKLKRAASEKFSYLNVDSMEIPPPWKLDDSHPGQIHFSISRNGIIFGSGEIVGFRTTDEHDIPYPVRNWIRTDNASVDFKDRLFLQNMAIGLPTLTKEVAKLPRGVDAFGRTEYIVNASDELTLHLGDDKKVYLGRVDAGGRICVDPTEKDAVYFLSQQNPTYLLKIDASAERISQRQRLEAQHLPFPRDFGAVKSISIDPQGSFFMLETDKGIVLLEKGTLKELKDAPGFSSAHFDSKGRIVALDNNGYFVILQPDLEEYRRAIEKAKMEGIVRGATADLFGKEEAETGKVDVDKFKHLLPIRTNLQNDFDPQIRKIKTFSETTAISRALDTLRSRLGSQGLNPEQVLFITKGIEEAIRAKQQELAMPLVVQGLADLQGKLSGDLTVAVLSEARDDLTKLKSLEGFVDEGTRAKIIALEKQLSTQSSEFFRRESPVIEKYGSDIVQREITRLVQITSKPDFDDWQEHTLPQQLRRLTELINNYPPDAPSETLERLLSFSKQLRDMAREYEIKFKERYAEVRQRGSVIMGERVGLIESDIVSFAERLRGRGFKDRMQAETHIGSSEALGILRSDIEELARQNPDAARELDRTLKAQIANIMFEIERGGLTTIAETGQQMELFGKTLFPRWEAPIKEKTQKKVDLIFIPNERSEGPGISPDRIYGDVGLAVINSRGKVARVRLFEGWEKENAVRLGILPLIPPSYVTYAEFGEIRKAYMDWNIGEKSKIRQELAQRSNVLREWRKARLGQHKSPQEEEEWKDLLRDYVSFYAENYISILHRVDRVKKAPEGEYENGKGFVPEWQSHWTVDETTEHYLEEMAKASGMQLDLQEGLLNLKGHAGTGKDVLVKMFSNRTNRPYFTIDCSKWTTEFELSEDVVLEAEDGASKTVKVPSVVLNAITTPGAIMYFNEINAMPEQAQIFLHGLMDEKRTLTLKTSSGKAVKTLPSVLLMGSMNPGYPGTFNPQFATKSRMVGLEIDYPPLYGERGTNDPNPNPPISAAEALRVARQVDSLADFTYEANPKHNEFVRIWDRYVNGIQNGAPDLNQVQRFDVEAILTMVEFAQKLREGFILKFEKARASSIPKGTLLVDQPITGREMRRMAYFLSKMSPEEKATANPEAVIRSLIERFFLSHIDKKDERDEIRTAMATWTSSKRPAA